MKRNLFPVHFIVFIAVALLSSALIKPGQLKKIVRCSLLFDQNGIFPGNELDVVLLTVLKDSTEIYSSTSNFTINFSNYDVELEGGAEIVENNRTQIKLRISDEAYNDPFVKVGVRLRRKPAIRWDIRLPIRYDVEQKVMFKGEDGYDPRSTTDNGYKKIPVTGRINIEFIDNQQTLTNNSDPAIVGGKGPDLRVFVSMVPVADQKEMVKVEIIDPSENSVVKYLKPGIGSLEINSSGGKGGISRSGGQGGDGGDVTVFIRKNALPYFDQIYISNFGGEGGELWRPKVDGQQRGRYGNDGELVILDWE